MFAAPFRYAATDSVAEAVALLAEHGTDAKVLAGGQSLIPLMKLRLAAPEVLIDIGRIESLRRIHESKQELRLGTMTTEADMEHSDLLRARYPILVDTSSVIADPLIRNLATVGGNVAHGDPANDHPATMVAVGARMRLDGPGGKRWVNAEDFFTDLFTTAAEPDELLTEVRLPAPATGQGAAYAKYERQVGDYAVAGAAAVVAIEDGTFTDVRIVLTNLGTIPVRARVAEDLLRHKPVDEPAFEVAASAAAESAEPWEDSRGSIAYKRRVAAAVTAQALRTATKRASPS